MADIVELLSRGRAGGILPAANAFSNLLTQAQNREIAKQQALQQGQEFETNQSNEMLRQRAFENQISSQEQAQINQMEDRQKLALSEKVNRVAALASNAKDEGQLMQALQSEGLQPDAIMNDPKAPFEFKQASILAESKNYHDALSKKTTPAIQDFLFAKKLSDEDRNLFLRKESVQSVKEKAGAKEGGKLEAQAKALPNIKAMVKKAEIEAKLKGETLDELGKAEAALPGLLEVTDKLKSLAPIATYTTTGKVFNFAAKEAGFGATKGATARAAFQAIIDNQVLPLLRQTFGAAFTAAEGDRLRATLGDVNATPEEKIAAIDAFISQSQRNIETKRREVGQEPKPKPSAGRERSYLRVLR